MRYVTFFFLFFVTSTAFAQSSEFMSSIGGCEEITATTTRMVCMRAELEVDRISVLSEDIAGHQTMIEQLNSRIANAVSERDLDELRDRIAELEADMADMRADLEERMDRLDRDIAELRVYVDNEFAEVREEVRVEFDMVLDLVGGIGDRVDDLEDRVATLETSIDSRFDGVRREMDELFRVSLSTNFVGTNRWVAGTLQLNTRHRVNTVESDQALFLRLSGGFQYTSEGDMGFTGGPAITFGLGRSESGRTLAELGLGIRGSYMSRMYVNGVGHHDTYNEFFFAAELPVYFRLAEHLELGVSGFVGAYGNSPGAPEEAPGSGAIGGGSISLGYRF